MPFRVSDTSSDNGYDVTVYCDTIADLPTKSEVAHYNLHMGCKAIIIATNDKYYLTGSGDWKQGASESDSGGGSTITIDDTVNPTSKNPVENRAIYDFVTDEISDKADKSTTLSGYGIIDATMNLSTGSIVLGNDSMIPVRTIKIGGVSQTNSAGTVNLPEYPSPITVDDSMIADSTNPVQSKVIQSALDEKPGDVTGTYNYSGTVLTNDVFNDLSNNIATNGSHAEGKGTSATGTCSHTEGFGTIVSAAMGGPNPIAGHAEGDRSEAHGYGSHAEGVRTVANDYASHAEGCETEANTQYSHAEGLGTIAGSQHQHVQGKYNVEDISHKYAFIIGNGTSKSARSNAIAIDWVGNIYIGNATTGINITTLTPTSSYSSTGTSPVNGIAVSKALQTLDSAQVGGDGEYIQSVSQTDGKISATAQTMDTEPISSSTKAITSDGVYESQQTQEVEIGVIANAGAKNLLNITSSTQTVNGVDFTINTDGTVTANGTAGSGGATCILASSTNSVIQPGNYLLSGCTNGSSTTYDLRFNQNGNKVNYNDDTTLTITDAPWNCEILIQAGQTVTNLTFKPMIRYAEIVDDTYAPYAPTNRQIYETISTDFNPILTAFPFMMKRGSATMNSSSGFGFDDIHETIYYRYTASAIGNPITNGYGLIITFFFTSYGIQFLVSQTTASSPTRLFYRFSSDTGSTWRDWREISTMQLALSVASDLSNTESE